MNFEIIIDDSLLSACSISKTDGFENKRILSIVNLFENGKWWAENFDSFIWDNLKETALSEKERKSLIDQDYTRLRKAARNLRLTDSESDPSKGSEIAEILLYGIMKKHYSALPVIPKIFYKQNNNDPVKGADSVHIIVHDLHDKENFSIWMGEAKFFNSIEDSRFDNIVSSIKEILELEKIRKENSIITSLGDIDLLIEDKALCENIKEALGSERSIDSLKPKLNIPILLLHECKITKGSLGLSKEYKDAIKKYHQGRAETYFKKQLDKLKSIHMYGEVKFHLILFPIPEKTEIINRFLNKANSYRQE